MSNATVMDLNQTADKDGSGPRPARIFSLVASALRSAWYGWMARSYRGYLTSLASRHAQLDADGRAMAELAFARAKRRTPALAQHLQGAACFAQAPETSKARYVLDHPMTERCLNGMLPGPGSVIDESSGSTGRPFHWVRGPRERLESQRFVAHYCRFMFGGQGLVTLNAFSQGAWATGLSMGLAANRLGMVKNTGPEVDKLIEAMRLLGPSQRYLIAGYPPFLKRFLDEAKAQGFALGQYQLLGMVGGEGMSEGLRSYLLAGGFSAVYSGYGASDLEIGVAGETCQSVALRQLALSHPGLRQRLFGDDPRLPMVFQYNPTAHYLEANASGELLCTILRPSLIQPRIRYNVGDKGGVASFAQVQAALAAEGFSMERLAPEAALLKLPFVWVHGRSDHTVSVMGANLYPEDVEQALYGEPELAQLAQSFCLGLTEVQGDPRPLVALELSAPEQPGLADRAARALLKGLCHANPDYRQAFQENPAAMLPVVQLWGIGQGPFSQDAGRIKQVRVLKPN